MRGEALRRLKGVFGVCKIKYTDGSEEVLPRNIVEAMINSGRIDFKIVKCGLHAEEVK